MRRAAASITALWLKRRAVVVMAAVLVTWAAGSPSAVQHGALAQGTPPFPTVPPSPPIPTLPPDVPTPSVFTPSPTPTFTPSITPTPSRTPTPTPRPSPTPADLFLPQTHNRLADDAATPTPDPQARAAP